ncbi:gluconate 2-dehydrogenase subunit 3 family protein [Nonomuraea sp. NPDC026600]|uniref:gluconate 2-dehydrogenase subunit 3 family protein n=1 Tax=Nonomuraea sp. NPDC026600 TaxID=3155363 RepID=UPI00340D45E2
MAKRPDEDPAPEGRRGPSRRGLLTGAGGVVAGGAIGVGVTLATGGQTQVREVAITAPSPLRVLSDAEAATVTAMAERVFPADEQGPGATEAGVTSYIDSRLAGGWGNGDRLYLRGPFHEPEHGGHGYQLPLTPCEVYKHVLPRIDAYCRQKVDGRAFTRLSADQQDKVLTSMEKGEIDLGLAGGEHGFTSASFFAMFVKNVTEGLFSDPSHGGNRKMIGWRWLGFPGDPMAYGDRYFEQIGRWNKPYNVAPKGVQ